MDDQYASLVKWHGPVDLSFMPVDHVATDRFFRDFYRLLKAADINITSIDADVDADADADIKSMYIPDQILYYIVNTPKRGYRYRRIINGRAVTLHIVSFDVDSDVDAVDAVDAVDVVDAVGHLFFESDQNLNICWLNHVCCDSSISRVLV